MFKDCRDFIFKEPHHFYSSRTESDKGLSKDNLKEVRKSLEQEKTSGKRLFCWIPGCTEGAMNGRVHIRTRHFLGIFNTRDKSAELILEM